MSNGGHLQPVRDDEEPAAAAGRGGGGRGGDFGERLARLEAHLEHVAKKEDVQALKTDLVEAIGNTESSMLRWQLGIVLAAGLLLVISTVVALVR